MIRKSGLVAFASATALSLSLAGCGSSSSSSSGNSPSISGSSGNKQLVIGVVLKTLSNPVWKGVLSGAESEGKKLGVTIKSAAGASESDITGQVNQVQTMLASGVDALVVTPNGTTQLAPILTQAVGKGIPVVLEDTDIPSFTKKSSFVQSDQASGATKVNQLITAALGDKAKGGEVGLLDYPGNVTVQARIDAAKAVFEGAGMKVVAELPGNCDRATALNSTTNMLTAHPQLAAIFGGCGQGATGAAQAVKNKGKSVLITGFDGINDEFADINAGTELGTVLQDFPALGAKSVDLAVDAANKKSVQAEVLIPGIIVTKDNISQYKPAG